MLTCIGKIDHMAEENGMREWAWNVRQSKQRRRSVP